MVNGHRMQVYYKYFWPQSTVIKCFGTLISFKKMKLERFELIHQWMVSYTFKDIIKNELDRKLISFLDI